MQKGRYNKLVRPTILRINENNFKHNVENIKNYIGENKKIIPVIKADAYGTMINKRLDLIKDFEIVAVAIADEGVALRENVKFNNHILILNEPYVEDVEDIVKYDLTTGAASLNIIEALNKEAAKQGKIVNIHIEIETGMNRTGFFVEDLRDFVEKIKLYTNVNVEGVYSHLSSADINEEYTRKQIAIFEEGVSILKENFDSLKYIHLEASTGTLNYNLDFLNAVRPGIILYGYKAIESQCEKINLLPVAELKTKISFLKEIKENSKVGYSGSYITSKNTKVATIPIGYADGMPRCLSNKGEVLINGYKVNIIGKICMDSFMVDVTDIPNVNVGDDVYIWDNDKISLESMAEKADTINYEILSRISKRVRREFF